MKLGVKFSAKLGVKLGLCESGSYRCHAGPPDADVALAIPCLPML